MAKSERQKRITGRVMHEFKHGELKSGRGGKAGTVKNRRQAIAIALEEAGATKYESRHRNQRNLRRTEQKEQRAGPDSRSARESRISAHHANGKAPVRWAEGMPKGGPQAVRRRQPLARGTRTAIPARNSTQRLSSNTLKVAQK